MTLEEAVEVLNREWHSREGSWCISSQGCALSSDHTFSFTPFEAIAIAEKYERRRDAEQAQHYREAAAYARKCMARPDGVSKEDWYKCRCAIEAMLLFHAGVSVVGVPRPEPINDWRNSIDPIEDPEHYAERVRAEKQHG